MWEVGLNIVQIPVLFSVIAAMIRKTGRRMGLFAAFFTFAMIALALEDIYWITYDFLRPDTWMPFAADEFAGSAAILLLGAALATKVDKDLETKRSELVFSVLFMAGCALLWIAWSGEWIQDIVFTAPYVYFLYVVIRGLRGTGSLERWQTYLAVVICAAVIILDAVALFVSEQAAGLLYNLNYVILNGTTILLFVKVLRSKSRPLFLSFALYVWSRLVIYLSSDLFYNIGLALQILTLPVICYAVISSMEKEGVQ